MEMQDPLYHFVQFNEQIINTYGELGLAHLSQRNINGKTSNVAFSEVLRKKKELSRLPYSDFKIHDEFDFISLDLKYVTAILYYLQPFIVNTRNTDGMYHQNLADKRYLMYANFGYQTIYNFWDRIGDLLHLYYETGLSQEKVYLGRVLTNMKDPYNMDRHYVKTNSSYIELKEMYDNVLKPFIDERNDAVHHFQLESKYFWGNIQYFDDEENRNKLDDEKQSYPEFMRNHLELFHKGFQLAIELINNLPDAVIVLIQRIELSENNFSISSIKFSEGDNLIGLFDIDDSYSNEQIVEIISKGTSADKRLIKILNET
jgi:hypothetical protein